VNLEPDIKEHGDYEYMQDILEDDRDESLTKLEYEELMDALDTPGL
jgi:uncharacterized protein (DUF1778 family)